MAANHIFTKLTKRALMTFPEGAYLASNCMRTRLIPVFEETIAPMMYRPLQWQRIVSSRANYRMCCVCASRLEYQQWLIFMCDAEDHHLLTTSQIQVSSKPGTTGS